MDGHLNPQGTESSSSLTNAVALSEMERSSGVGPVLDQSYETGHRLTRLMSLIARDMNN